ncbi:DUF4245 domain-containing protein [Actinoplanes sp. NPDC049599]|uniref:DUF4245 domain-containing protein n=1 Tax=Actinoplanes sp. NPDC049599 TaxID=3363903 RepID=UPI00379DD86A
MATPEAAPAPDAAAEPVTVGKRGGRSPRDMAMSLAVLLVPIALLLIFYRVVLDGDKPISVDAGPTIQQARSAAAFPVVLPQGLGDDWHTVSATFKRDADGATLRIGYVDPDSDPIQLVQSSTPTAKLLPVELGDDPKAVSTYRDGARTWQRYDAREGENALLLLEKGRTIIVVGMAGSERLESFAASLG